MSTIIRTEAGEIVESLRIYGSRLSSHDNEVVDVAIEATIGYVKGLLNTGRLTDALEAYIADHVIPLVQDEKLRLNLTTQLDIAYKDAIVKDAGRGWTNVKAILASGDQVATSTALSNILGYVERSVASGQLSIGEFNRINDEVTENISDRRIRGNFRKELEAKVPKGVYVKVVDLDKERNSASEWEVLKAQAVSNDAGIAVQAVADIMERVRASIGSGEFGCSECADIHDNVIPQIKDTGLRETFSRELRSVVPADLYSISESFDRRRNSDLVVSQFIQETASRIIAGETIDVVLGQFRERMIQMRAEGDVRDSHLYQAKSALSSAIKSVNRTPFYQDAFIKELIGYLEDINRAQREKEIPMNGSSFNPAIAHLVNGATASLRGGVIAGVEIINELKEALLGMVTEGGLTRPQLQEVANAIAAVITNPADGCVLATLETEVMMAINNFEFTGFSSALPAELQVSLNTAVAELQKGVASTAWILGQLRPVVVKMANSGQLTEVQLSELHKVVSGHIVGTSDSTILSNLCKEASRAIRRPSMVTPATETERLTAMERRISALEQDRGRRSYYGYGRGSDDGRGFDGRGYDGRDYDDGRRGRHILPSLQDLYQRQAELMIELEQVQTRIMQQATSSSGRGRW